MIDIHINLIGICGGCHGEMEVDEHQGMYRMTCRKCSRSFYLKQER